MNHGMGQGNCATKNKKISKGHETIKYFELFREAEDPRQNNANRQHEFVAILVIALCGI
jgi:hypothetical protein